MKKRPRTFAPRLTSGDCREVFWCCFPPEVKDGIQQIARIEHKSANWVMEEAVYSFFGLERPAMVNDERPTKARRRTKPHRGTNHRRAIVAR
jgi:hypothetical protein